MKACIYRLGIVLILVISHLASLAQNITGIWRGYFITESNDQYKFELQVEQNKTNRISGVSYSYLTTVFYGKASLTGYFNKTPKTALIQEIKTIEVRMSGSSVACIMKCQFEYTQSGKEEFLEGTFTSMYEKTDRFTGIKRGGDCGTGKIFLRKVPTSDFYVEPFLRDKPSLTKPPVTTPKNSIAKNTKPVITPPVTKNVTIKNAGPKTPAAKSAAPPKSLAKTTPKADTVHKRVTPPVAEEAPKKIELQKPDIPIPPVIRNRQNELLQTVNVQSDHIELKIYDNGEIDDDTVSVYLDNRLVLSNKRLSEVPLTVNVTMSDDNEEHTIVMVAENLGRIPPNTSLMIVHDGDKRYEVRITSTETKNAVIRFRRQKPK